MTLKKIAEAANVSVSTVSKAFSWSSEISEEKRQYIFEIAKREGCYDKHCKPKFSKKVIAVICPEVQGGYYTQQITLFEKEIKKRGAVMVVGVSDFDENSKNEMITYFSQCAKVDGIIVYGSNTKTECNVPAVAIGSCNELDSVVLSHEKAILDAVEYFIENGHKDIAFIGEKRTERTFKTFVEVLKNRGIAIDPDRLIESSERFEEAGYEAMNTLLSMDKPVTAVFAAYDRIAVGAMKSIYEHGLDVPGDISLIGINDNSENHYMNVPLTSITSYNEDFCEIVVDVLFDRIKNGKTKSIKRINVSAELVKHSSVGKAKQ